MTDESQPPDGEEIDDQADAEALALCRAILSEDFDAHYRDVRKEGRERGVKVTRRVFTMAVKEISVKRGGDEAPHGEPEGHSDRSAPPPEHPPESPRSERRESLAPWQRPAPHHRPDAPRQDGGREAPPGRARQARGQWDDLWKGGASEAPAPPDPTSPGSTDRDVLGFLSDSRTPGSAPRRNTVDFMAEHLRKSPETSYRQMREVAEDAGFTVSAAAFGRAQVQAGILEPDESSKPVLSSLAAPVSPKKRSTDTATPKPRAPRRAPKRPKRELKFRTDDPTELLEDFIEHLARSARDRDEFRFALEEMLRVVQDALR